MRDRRYRDRHDAGQQLAARLTSDYERPRVIVLALPRGGLPVAAEVAQAMDAPLDVVVVRKIGVPYQPELAMGAMASIAGVEELVLNQDVMDVTRLAPGQDAFDEIVARERIELGRRESVYRAGREPLDLTDRTVILVDDGMATGSTMMAAAAAIRRQKPARLIAVVPVGLGKACERLGTLANEVVCPWSAKNLGSVGQAYISFDQTSDAEVQDILADAWSRGR
ncbi:phosphoribosyltransferase family protein [Saxibacter everestensis]|uniref:Phosphoribosyltransferase family protein n=1 Tax=Saxibacter everestensis TaxID=2909229 RepID=A0ABY8QSZ4_9MICO|nr:phosphoribosyltransferase family protein [Brevibacteriaceae bacterium ZFBP1038]